MTPLLDVSNVAIHTPGGRPLFEGLDLRLAREHVALIGRNGVGKSTLLAVLSGAMGPEAGRVTARSAIAFVPQQLDVEPDVEPRSHGERRQLALLRAMESGAGLLLLDEPTEDLDEPAVAWLRDRLARWSGGLVVASHDRELLQDFRHFFIASESGCRHFAGTLAELELELARAESDAEERYVRRLRHLAEREEHTERVARRKARKKRYGRCSELDRATSRLRLNQKRGEAQVSHGRLAQIRDARLDAVRQWSKATRRALGPKLPLELPVPALPAASPSDLIVLRDVSVAIEGRTLFRGIDLRVGRGRVAVIGPNGSGKTTLLDVIRGRRVPTTGAVSRDPTKIGAIEQSGADWMLDESLLSYLSYGARGAPAWSMDELAKLIVAHGFPLALAERPLRSLSPGERTRAALICLFRRTPPPELLVLDEPTRSLDLLAQAAITKALRTWLGGLIVASHDRAFLAAIGVDATIDLGERGACVPSAGAERPLTSSARR